MTIEQLDAAHKAQPFRPFTLHLADGSSVPVRHPEFMYRTQGGRTIIVNPRGEETIIIDLLLVTKITIKKGKSGKNGR